MGTRVLVVDDDSAFCELVQAILGSAGIKAELRTNGQEALASLGAEKFDALFLDIRCCRWTAFKSRKRCVLPG